MVGIVAIALNIVTYDFADREAIRNRSSSPTWFGSNPDAWGKLSSSLLVNSLSFTPNQTHG
jgi:hypothetical protein